MNQVSIISDRPDYHSVFVRNGEDVVELVGTHPWRTLFKAVMVVKFRQLKRRLYATERKADIPDSPANVFPITRPVPTLREWAIKAGARQVGDTFYFDKANIKGTLIPVERQTVDELRGARATKKNRGRKGKAAPDEHRSPAA